MKRSTEQSMAWPQDLCDSLADRFLPSGVEPPTDVALWRFACDKTHNCDLFSARFSGCHGNLCIQPDPRQSQKAMKFRQEQRAEMELGVEAATRDQADHLGG